MAGSSIYAQIKHKKITGLVCAQRAAKCTNCGGVSPQGEMSHGWCIRCMKAWGDTADPVMIAQARMGYAPSSCLPAPSPRKVEQITETIIEPKDDKEFLPLLMFLGNHTIGRVQALWNFIKTMEALELKTTGEVFRLSKASHDTTHRCGLHAPVQRSTIDGYLSRLMFAENFKPLERDTHLQQYLEWFIRENRLFLFPRTPIDATSEWSRQAWRRIPKVKWAPLAQCWPFLQAETSSDHDAILAVDSVIPKGIPEQWRQDMCQDLMVALLTGEITRDNLRDMAPEFIKGVWRMHPIKYGPMSLDAPPPWMHDGRPLSEVLADACLEMACEDKHEEPAEDRRNGFALGDILREKHAGIAVEGLVLPPSEAMDPDIEAVYMAEVNARGKGRSAHANHEERHMATGNPCQEKYLKALQLRFNGRG